MVEMLPNKILPVYTLVRVNKLADIASSVTYKWLHQIIHFCGL